MHIIVTAQFCKFEDTATPGVTMMSTMLFSDTISRETVEVKNKADVAMCMVAVFDRVKAAHPGRSFYVSQTRHPRDPGRAFAGYKDLRGRMEYNADKDLPPVAVEPPYSDGVSPQ